MQATVPGGTVKVIDRCPPMDRYGHDPEKRAMARLRPLARERGAKVL